MLLYVFLVSSALATRYKIKMFPNYLKKRKKGNWKLKENTN